MSLPCTAAPRFIPNPRADRLLEAGDKLLCYGKLEFMRRMVPEKTRRRRQPRLRNLAASAGS